MKRSPDLVPLSHVCDVIDPHPSHRAPERAVGGIPFVGIGDFDSNGTLQIEKARIVPASFLSEHKARYSLQENLLAIGRVASIGKVVRLPKISDPFLVSPTLAIVRPRSIDISYLFFALHSPQFQEQLANLSRGSTRRSVGIVDLRTASIPLPPSPEQQRIVALLDEAFDGIATAKASAEKNLQNARAIFESHLQSVFTRRGDGWTERPLADVTTIINGFAFKSGDFSPHAKVQSIKITNVGVREFVCESDSLLPLNFLETYASFSIRAGSIVIALTRTIISNGLKVAVVPDEFDGALLNQRVAAILVSRDLLNAEFLFSYLSSQYVFDYVKAHVNTLMQPNLSINDLRALPIPLPPVIEQERIASRLETLKDETKRFEAIYQQKLTALDELKKSLLHRAFNGDL